MVTAARPAPSVTANCSCAPKPMTTVRPATGLLLPSRSTAANVALVENAPMVVASGSRVSVVGRSSDARLPASP